MDGDSVGLNEGAVVLGDSVGLDVDSERVGLSVSPGWLGDCVGDVVG